MTPVIDLGGLDVEVLTATVAALALPNFWRLHRLGFGSSGLHAP